MQVDESARELSSRYFFVLYTTMIFRVANIIFSTLLRAVGDTKTPMKAGIIVNVVNVVFNAILIYDPITVTLFGASVKLPFAGMGVVGAALSSALSYAVGGIIMTVAIYRHPEISPKGQSYKPCGEILIPCMKIAIPNAIQRFGTSLGYVAFASIVNSLGEVSTAAHTIANTVESAFYIPGYGMQTATATLVGNAYGAKDGKRIRELSATILFLEVGMMIASGGLLFAFAPDMVGIFSQDAAVIMLGAFVLRMVALSEPFYGVSIVLEGVMQGMGKTTFPLIANVIGMWAVRIVGTFICVSVLGLGLISAWACMIAHNMMLFLAFVIYYFAGKWNPERSQKSYVHQAIHNKQ
jgi:putative MATE family efflux protein